MQLSEKLQTFSLFFIRILEAAFNFEHFEKTSEPQRSSFSEIIYFQRRVWLNA